MWLNLFDSSSQVWNHQWCFNAMHCKDNKHLWRHVNESLTDFKMPTYDQEMGMPCILKKNRMHPRMMSTGNDVDRQCIVAFEILTLASLHCMEQCQVQLCREALQLPQQCIPPSGLDWHGWSGVPGLACVWWHLHSRWSIYTNQTPWLVTHHHWDNSLPHFPWQNHGGSLPSMYSGVL